jgi:hypothetical protein
VVRVPGFPSQACWGPAAALSMTMPNNESVDIFGRRRRHPEKCIDCAAKFKPKRKPRIDAVIKAAEKTGAKVRGATVTADGSVSLQFADDVKPNGSGAYETPEDLRKLI